MRKFWFLIIFICVALSGVSYAQQKVVIATTKGGMVGLITETVKLHNLDKKNGIELDLKYFDPAKAEEAVFYRQVDAGIFVPIALARVNLKGHNIRMFGPFLWNHTSLMVRKGAPYRSLEDLKGKKLGTLARISGLYTSLAIIARMKGMDLEKDFHLVFGTPPVLFGLLKRGDVDAIVHFDPFVSRMITEGWAEEVLRVNDLWKELTGQPMLMVGLSAYEDWIKKNPELAKKVAKTMADGVEYIKAHTDQVVEALREPQGIKTDAEAALLKKRYPIHLPERWDEKIIESAHLVIRKNVEYGLLERMPEKDLFIILK